MYIFIFYIYLVFSLLYNLKQRPVMSNRGLGSSSPSLCNFTIDICPPRAYNFIVISPKMMRETVGTDRPSQRAGAGGSPAPVGPFRTSLRSRSPNRQGAVGAAGFPRYRKRVCWYAVTGGTARLFQALVPLRGGRLFVFLPRHTQEQGA